LSSSSRFQTAILHKCSTIPNHNSEPLSRLHAHSVQPSQILNQGTTHADVMQRRPLQTQNGSKKRQLVSLINGRSKVRVTPFFITMWLLPQKNQINCKLGLLWQWSL
jgi:hypothetical protein